MTKVIIRKTTDGEFREFSCTGHAGFAYSGRDIVCAAISILVINTINSMEKLAGEELETAADEKAGSIACRFRRRPSEGGRLLMDSMILGLSHIEKQYGSKYLAVIFEEV
ncbi:MAG: ribosomal-processing cysteine protease Prp [Kineothrix sp.]